MLYVYIMESFVTSPHPPPPTPSGIEAICQDFFFVGGGGVDLSTNDA